MAITQVISTLPTAPDPSTMTRDQFSTAAAASVLAQKAMVPEINTWTSQVNAIVSGTAGDIASGINGATAKTTPVDADLLGITDSAASFTLKKLTWANLKATLGSTFAALAGSASQAFSVAAATAAAHAVRLDQINSAAVPAFSAYQNSAQTLGSGAWAKINLQAKEFDTTSAFDSTTNYRFTPLIAGYYQINGRVSNGATVAAAIFSVQIYKNGGEAKRGGVIHGSVAKEIASNVSALLYLNGTTDYVELFAYQDTGGNQTVQATAISTYFQGFLAVRAA